MSQKYLKKLRRSVRKQVRDVDQFKSADLVHRLMSNKPWWMPKAVWSRAIARSIYEVNIKHNAKEENIKETEQGEEAGIAA
jgi:hypothetical protein